MLSKLIFVFSLAGTFFQATANPTFENAVSYLLALVDETKDNDYNILTDSSRFNQFNRMYESVDRSGITGQDGRPQLVEACQAVAINMQHFNPDSQLGQIMKERFGPTKPRWIIKALSKADATVSVGTTSGRVAMALSDMDEICGHLFGGQTAQPQDQKLKDVFNSLLKFDLASGSADDVQCLYELYGMLNDPNDRALLEEACHYVTANIKTFHENSVLGEMLMEKFGHPKVENVIRCLYQSTYNKKAPSTKGGKLAAALFKMDEACAQLFPGPNAQSSTHQVATK